MWSGGVLADAVSSNHRSWSLESPRGRTAKRLLSFARPAVRRTIRHGSANRRPFASVSPTLVPWFREAPAQAVSSNHRSWSLESPRGRTAKRLLSFARPAVRRTMRHGPTNRRPFTSVSSTHVSWLDQTTVPRCIEPSVLERRIARCRLRWGTHERRRAQHELLPHGALHRCRGRGLEETSIGTCRHLESIAD